MAEIPASQHVLKDGTIITIRVGKESDVPQILRCVEACGNDGEGSVWEPGEFQITPEQERQWIMGMLVNQCELLLVAEHNDTLVASLNFHVGKRKREAHVGEFGMAVLKEWRSKGIGSLLLETLIRWAEQNPAIEKINLQVLAYNERAISLYLKYGFVEEGRKLRELKYADGTYTDAILMSRFTRLLHSGNFSGFADSQGSNGKLN